MTKMYVLKLDKNKYVVVCNKCHERGYVKSDCTECGGKGVRFKTTNEWISKKITIDKIDRANNGELRYWTDMNSFYKENDRYIHFTSEDAKKECSKRNTLLAKVKNTNIITNKVYYISL